MPNVGEALTRKIGPLPAWGWGVAIGGGLLAMRMMRGGGGSQRETIMVPTGAPQPSDELQSQFGVALYEILSRLDDIEQNANNNTDDNDDVPSPPAGQTPGTSPNPIGTPRIDGIDLGTWLAGLRKRFPDIAARARVTPPTTETAAQRRARLEKELAAYGTAGQRFDLGTYIQGLRGLYPAIASLWTRTQSAGETVAQRNERLLAELKHFASKGVGPASMIPMTATTGPAQS